MGRQPTTPKQYKDGFYIEVCDHNSKSGIKICSINKDEMMRNIKSYERTKSIIIWGEHRNGKWVHDKKIHEPKTP